MVSVLVVVVMCGLTFGNGLFHCVGVKGVFTCKGSPAHPEVPTLKKKSNGRHGKPLHIETPFIPTCRFAHAFCANVCPNWLAAWGVVSGPPLAVALSSSTEEGS